MRKPVIGLALLWCAGIEISRLWSYKATHVESSDVRKPVKENTRKSESEGKTTESAAGRRSAIYGRTESGPIARIGLEKS